MSTMTPLADHLNEELCWVQPRTMRRGFELHAVASESAEAPLATLTFASALGSLATGETATGAWSLKRVGFFRPRVTVRKPGSDENVAVYEPRWTGTEGAITFADTRRYRWRTTNFWTTRYEIVDELDRVLLSYQAGCARPKLGDLLRTEARLEVTATGADHADIDLLALLGWYLIVLYREDQAATIAAVTAVS